MKKVQPHKGISVRFRRWSRKTYSVFASLGKSISIGNLSVQMAVETLFRKVELIKLIVSTAPEKEDNPEEELTLLLSEDLVLTNLVSKVSGEYPATNYTYLYHLS